MAKPIDRQIEVLRYLKRQLVDGRFVPGDRLPNRWDLERELGASRVTIQAAFDRLLADGFVEARGRAGTFVAMRPPHLNCFGVVFMDHHSDWQSRGHFAKAIQKEAAIWAQSHDTNLKIYEGVEPANEANEAYVQLLADAREHRLAGLILITPLPEFMESALMSLPPIPMVSIQASEISTVKGIPSLLIDREDFITRAIDAVVATGRRRVGGLILAGTMSPRNFQEFIIEPILARGMETRPYWWQIVTHSDSMSASHAVEMMMQMPRRAGLDALIIEDDTLVESATRGLIASGIKVPADVAVVARANFPYPTPSLVPASRIGVHIGHIMEEAVDSLQKQRRAQRVPRQIRVLNRSEQEWDLESQAATPTMSSVSKM